VSVYVFQPRVRPIHPRESSIMSSTISTWTKFISNAGDDEFKQQMAAILSDALATLDTIPDEELERLVDCE